ncbi:MAG: hypothetical protein R2752_00120 [Vicinamibacterales bacterium]
MEAATKALGWNLKTLIYDPSKPQEVNSTVMQAVAANPDYIAIAGSPPEQWQEGLDAAKAKGIPIFDPTTRSTRWARRTASTARSRATTTCATRS